MKSIKYIVCIVLIIGNSHLAFSIIKSDIELNSNAQTAVAKVNESVLYKFKFQNTHILTETYYLSINRPRELACRNSLSQEKITLAPGEVFQGTLTVVISDRIPEGGHEQSVVIVKDEKGNILKQFGFVTVRTKEHPFLLVTNPVFEESKEKIEQYDWAKKNLNNMLIELNGFEFPERKIITKPRPTKVWSSLNYKASDGEKAFQLALAYKLTGEKIYKDKLISFIKKVCDKEEGYLSIGAATNGVQVHEGNFFLFLSAACDIIFNEPELSDKNKKDIDATFRYYLKQNRGHMKSLGIMNHQASANAGAILVALYLQDTPEVDFLTNAEGGMADQIGKGVMADGWWFESTANYCYLVTQRYTLIAQAFKNYGLDLYHTRFPVKFKSVDFENAKEGFTGMKFDNWGPTGKNTRGVKDMVTPYIPMMDENANVVSSNDSNLKEPDDFYELAYREYKIDELAWVISKTNRDSWVSLIYGVPELPQIEDPRTESQFLPNVGLVALRSQPEIKKPDEQIQAYLKYGTHGGWHGHFDRASLVALDRNGHKYFGTEMVWFGYGNAGYKECVQTSATHNMVVVDELQQEAVPSEQLLFFKGDMMQVSVVETNARWRKIPMSNSEKFPPWDDTDYEADFKPIQQRRFAIVTDDYVVVADYLKSDIKHNYDWLIHPIGFQSIYGPNKKGNALEQLSTDNSSPFKYFKNAQWYKTNKGVKVEFKEDNNKLDIYTLWPKKADILLSNYPNGGKQRGIRNNPERKTYGIRLTGKEGVFLNVMEPYQNNSVIEKIVSNAPNELTVFLVDGRKQTIVISGLKQNSIKVNIKEFLGNKEINSEETSNN